MEYSKTQGSFYIRNSNIELLRIISMILIVAHHYAVHGFSELTHSVNHYIVDAFSLWGKLGVNCFVLISGYFMVNSKITARKLIRLIMEVWFYSVGISFLFLIVLTPVKPISITNIIKACIPVGYSEYWFVTAYIFLMCISPMLNLLIEKINKSMHLKIVIVLFSLWSVSSWFIRARYGYNELNWFAFLYILAAYIKKYIKIDTKTANRHFIIAGLSCAIIWFSSVFFTYIGFTMDITILYKYRKYLATINSPFALLAATELFIGFLSIKPIRSKFVNTLATATFGVYLIHDNELMRSYLWKTIFKNADMYSSSFLILHAVVSIMLVYLICAVIDLIRQRTIEKVFLKLFDKYYELLHSKVLNITNKIYKIGNNFITKYYAE